jgi:apolipoprotein N-acyltransferase
VTARPPRELGVHALAVTAGAAALALAFPGTDWSGAAWVALAPVIVQALVLRRPRAALGLGWLGGFVFFLLLLRWLNFTFRVYSTIPWPLVWVPTALLAAYCGLYVGLFASTLAWIAARRSIPSAAVAAPFVWVVLEWVRGWLMGGFPWGNLGYSQYRQLAVIQIAELGGVYAVSFVVIAVNAALAAAAVLGGRRALVALAAAALLFAATLTFGHARLRALAAPAETAAVAVIQPSIAQPLKWDPNFAASTLANYFELTRRAGQARPALIVWPETATPTVLREDPALQAALRGLSREVGAPLLVGSIDAERSSPPKWRNSAFLLDERGIANRYDKIQLVPFGEYVPLSGVIGFVRGWAEFIADLEPGSRSVVFSGPPAPFGTVICYEGVFPALVRRFVRDGARFMVNMTNDGWFGQTAGPLQHLAMYPLRAVEHRVSIVRAANTGVSAVIDPSGLITRSLPLFARGTLVERVSLRTGETLYTRFGDWLVYLALAVSALVLAGVAWRRA